MYIFSGISFVLMTFKPLRENYGMAIPKTLLATSIQYYMTFIIVGLSAGYTKVSAEMTSSIAITSVSFADPPGFLSIRYSAMRVKRTGKKICPATAMASWS